ncbi:MAG: right-handed parallel beta-helix repeat-containing protein [Thermoanaerobaculia bacterium]|nr:right-handed parallel beta-helix repeat-containing protein [Thermoanaerobaculia bacterium]
MIRPTMMKCGAVVWMFLAVPMLAEVIAVPGDSGTIQGALDAAQPGDVVEVATGTYFEKVVFPRSGTLGQPIVLRAGDGAQVVLDGTGVGGENMVLIESRSHVQLIGFEIRNNLAVTDGSGVRIVGAASGVEIRNNSIHEIRGENAMGITVYGTETAPIEDLVIQGNEIFDCEPAPSEALTLNGNVTDFEVSGNFVHDVDNIGIDFIGGETDIQPNPALVARNGVVRGNTVLRANSIYEGGYAGGIYVDGGRDILIENNRVGESDLGIEIGAENAGLVTTGIVVRNNVLHHNERAGIVFGGYEAAVGRANGNSFTGNTLFANNTVGENGTGTHFVGGGIGEIWVQFAADNVVSGNIVFAGPENVFVGSFDAGSSLNNAFDYNLYFGSENVSEGEFSHNGTGFVGLPDWQSGTGLDSNSLAADPLLVDPTSSDWQLGSGSPAIDRGDPSYVVSPGESDFGGGSRVAGGRIDIGAEEVDVVLFADGFETGDLSAW